jgi:hypothetical protein
VPPVRILLALAALAVAICIQPAGAGAADICQQLTPTKHVKKNLRAAHARLTDRKFSGPKGRVYYGRCGTKRWYALATFKDAKTGTGDQPEQFLRKPHQRWHDRGDTGGDVCGAAPRQLTRLWGFTNC